MPSESYAPGAPAAVGEIPLCVPNIGGNEWEYLRACLDTGWVSSAGPFVERFEAQFAHVTDGGHAIATSTGTAALHVAVLLAGVQPGEEVILPALSFIAPANAVRYAGAWPAFVDVDRLYWQLDPNEVEAFLREDCVGGAGALRNRHTNRRVTAILPVDVLGHPVDLDRIHALAQEFGLAVVEDATESLGARYHGRPLGSCSPITCFSFNGNKLLTTGGGGMLVTRDERLAKRARYLTTQAKDDALEFVHGEVGFNYRLTNVQAAIGLAQLEQLSAFVAAKRRIAERYSRALSSVAGLQPMREAPWARSAHWLYTVLVDARISPLDSRQLLRGLAGRGIQSRPLWQPLHRSPAHTGSFARSCPVAEETQRNALSLPCSTGLSDADQDRVIESVASLLASDRAGVI